MGTGKGREGGEHKGSHITSVEIEIYIGYKSRVNICSYTP